MVRVTFDITPDWEANIAGEILLTALNDQIRWGIDTTEFNSPGWKRVYDLSLKTKTLHWGCFAKLKDSKITAFYNPTPKITVSVSCDGDTAVVFYLPGGDYLVNDDAKKDHTWEWNPDWANDLPDSYYESGYNYGGW